MRFNGWIYRLPSRPPLGRRGAFRSTASNRDWWLASTLTKGIKDSLAIVKAAPSTPTINDLRNNCRRKDVRKRSSKVSVGRVCEAALSEDYKAAYLRRFDFKRSNIKITRGLYLS